MLKKVVNGLVFSIVPIVLFYLMEGFEHNAFLEVRQLAQVYNIFLFELLAWLLFFVTGSGRMALRIEAVAAFLYGLVNHYVMAFRSTPFVPWDVYSIRTAASVAGNYDFTPTKEVLLVSGGFFLVFVLLQGMRFYCSKKIIARGLSAAMTAVVLSVFVQVLWDDDFQRESYLYPYLFTPAHMTKVNGMAVTFAMDMEYLRVEKPDGYSVKKAKEILAEYEISADTENDLNSEIPTDSKVELNAGMAANSEAELNTGMAADDEARLDAGITANNDSFTYDENMQSMPNIIVIMNEAFSDLAVLGDFTTNEDYMPFIHRLQRGYENTITGNLEVSVCGGNTANSEFEFLTGHTMDYFPIGSIPFQQYITEELPSLASHLKDLGYAAYGMHPYNASGWERDEVYPLLGFETAYFLHDFEGRQYIRNYVSDKTAYEKIIQTYEEKEYDVPMFVFEVTMQNHGGYTENHANFKPDIQVEEVDDDALNQYLSLMKVSDAEFEKLVEYFANEEEETIIVFFGDHQPSDSVVSKILRLNGIHTTQMTIEEAELRYQVPYVVWANFDIEEAKEADTDISFLAAEVLEAAGIPTTAYQRFLLDLKYHADDVEYLEKYQILQYYYMFDYEDE